MQMPILEHVNELGVTDNDAIPISSVEPPSTSGAVIDTLPDASNCTVIFWQTATGGASSIEIIANGTGDKSGGFAPP